jgi:Cu2+-exporting ATPase
VCDFIIDSGNGEFYRHREGISRTFNDAELPELLDKIKLYDDEEIQREFVRRGKDNDWREAWLVLDEIRCAACIWLNEKTLRKLDGVLEVQMDYTGQQARVRWQPEKIKLSEILSAITSIGYSAHPFDPSQRESLNKELKHRSVQRIIFALLLGMAVMQSSIGGYFFGEPDALGNYPLWYSVSRWMNVVSTFLILIYPGQLFFRNAWRDLKNRSLGMDVPVVIGLTVAWSASFYNTLSGEGEVYFESIAMFVIFLLVARYIELRSRISATALLDRSSKIIPQMARLIEGENIRQVPVIELKKGDKVQISPGEVIPVDGLLCSARSSFDESLLTGESLPVSYSRGQKVLGGSINVDQLIEIEVLSGKADSTLNEIHELTQRSVASRPRYIELAEKIAGKFVAVVITIAILTYVLWYWYDPTHALSHMISVLIVTCPCALALAAPVALSLGAAGLSRLHVLPVRMASIEKISHIDTVVFDKTGTLTAGVPVLEKIQLTGKLTESACLCLAKCLEQGSQHPFAKAILTASVEHEIDSIKNRDALKHYPGQGVEASIDDGQGNRRWRLGSESFVRYEDSVIENDVEREIEESRKQGKSVLYLSNDNGVQAVFHIVDPLRKGIEQFLVQLKQLGITNTVILSGDHQYSVDAVASQLGITEAYGSLLPEQKLAWLKNHQAKMVGQQHKRAVLMFGDGVNDAPTMAVADVSLAFVEATDLAKNNCDFMLLGKDFGLLGTAFRLMNRTRSIILQNLAWAIIYNGLAVPAAVAGLVTPWMAAAGMSLSSLLVVLNSLRLKKAL